MHHTINTYGDGGIAPPFLTLVLDEGVSFMPRLLYSLENMSLLPIAQKGW
jgi:hypothetical protein